MTSYDMTIPQHMARKALLALALLTATSQARAAVPTPEQRQLAFEVDASGIDGVPGERLDGELRELTNAKLRESGFIVTEADSETTLRLRVEMVDAELREYVIGIDLFRGDDREVVVLDAQCLACTEEALLERTEELLTSSTAEIETLVHELEARADRASTPNQEPGHRLGPVGYSAIGTISGGAITILAGAIVFGTSPTGDSEFHISYDRRKPGAALIGVGIAGAVLGVAGLITDITVFQPRNSRRIDVALDASPNSAGVWVRGRF
jgi:hypothetical protein